MAGALVLVAAGIGAGWLAGGAVSTSTRQETPPTISSKRVVYLAYLDDAHDDRLYHGFERLVELLNATNPRQRTPVAVEYQRVVVGELPTIEETARTLVATNPAAIVATSHDVLEAVKSATQRIPILFMSHADPVEAGHVRSIAAPGVNRTGFTFHAPMFEKSIELLLDGYPASRRIGVVLDELAARQLSNSQALHHARSTLRVTIDVFVAQNRHDLARVLAQGAAQSVDAWFVPAGAALWYDTEAVIVMMANTRKPVLYDRTGLVRTGGLMSYEARVVEPFRIWAHQLLLILDGVDAATIPIERPSHFELALNLEAIAKNERLRPAPALLERVDVFVGRGAPR